LHAGTTHPPNESIGDAAPTPSESSEADGMSAMKKELEALREEMQRMSKPRKQARNPPTYNYSTIYIPPDYHE